MKNWKKSDIGKRIRLIDGEVIIYDVNPDVPNTIRFAEYPIIFKPEIGVIQSPIALESKIGLAYAVKSQEKKGEEYLEKTGDWSFIDRVSKDEMWVLDILARSPKKPLDVI